MLDLNSPPSDIREQEGTSQQVGLEEATGHPIQPVPLDTIDVEAIEDDVIESSATAFAEAKNNSRRSGRRTVVDVDSGWPARQTTNNQNKRQGNYKAATTTTKGTKFQLSNLHGFVNRGDVDKGLPSISQLNG
ncbi:hypothetical protein V6N13_112664 [Hibiscus sabdariffa]